MKGISIIIPAFNEEPGIGGVLEEVEAVLRGSGPDFEIIVVDDGSTDRTGEIVRGTGAVLLEQAANRGYGAALKLGISRARYERVLIVDADGTYPPAAIPSLLREAKDYDMAVGARTGKKVAIPPFRRFPKWLLKKLADYLTGMRIPDLNSGLRVFKKEAAEKFLPILPDGFSFTTTITVAFLCNGFSVRYVPIDYHKRSGRSKFRPFSDTLNLLNLIIRTSLYFNPLKIFVPAAGLLLAAGLVLLVHRLIAGGGGMVTTVVLLMAGLQFLALGLLADLIDKRSSR
jgi:glycosyltransferase involved in cell wall biosynthesis